MLGTFPQELEEYYFGQLHIDEKYLPIYFFCMPMMKFSECVTLVISLWNSGKEKIVMFWSFFELYFIIYFILFYFNFFFFLLELYHISARSAYSLGKSNTKLLWLSSNWASKLRKLRPKLCIWEILISWWRKEHCWGAAHLTPETSIVM